ncbi:MAG TPA: universal stress protein, partial [Gemmatimonadaceae bacterium]|nr:universal stress protein [Gemmatimonadaceae bacterium]
MRRLSVASGGEDEVLRIGRVLVAVDFGTPSLAAARWVARHLAPDAEVVLAHVLPVPGVPAFLRGHMRSPDSFVDEVSAPMRGGLEGLAEALGAARVQTELRA